MSRISSDQIKSPRCMRMLGDCRFASNDETETASQAIRHSRDLEGEVLRLTDKMREEYDSGLDDVPTARMERDDPERWEDA